ncbi:MAG: tRNA pseudouridine(55) synthase TruB [Candidatus Dormibacteraeota bacterium]|jgi:tRNA pseudouridine55 synthase|nr:tRNA pseudouridine(55) synthase TruB [Candidatus Dormibacteraeota bacterium]
MRAGVLNVSKPAGATSFSVVRRLRDLTRAKRVGHAGTLDPLATGVLPILFESATRLSDFAHQLPKSYEARVHLGFRTATDDAEAEPEPVADPAALGAEEVSAALAGFVGRISQQPPAFSAVKVDGRRAYERARAGEADRPAAREVEVYSAELLEFEPGEQATALIRVVCGSGVYLRSLARDLGDRLGVGGYLGRLARTAYGPLRLEESSLADELADLAAVEARLQPPEVLLPAMERVRLTIEQEAQVRLGRSVRVLPEPRAGLLRAHDQGGRLVALGHTDPLRRTFVPDKVLG